MLDSLAQSGGGSEAGEDQDEPRPSDAASPGSNPRRYQHYEILTREDGSLWELGHGAMGITSKAIDVNLRVPVALKVINARYSRQASARRRFLREARSAAPLRHPNVASVFHFGTITPAVPTAGTEATSSDPEDQGECFYTMEFVEGETLQERLRRTGPFNVRLTLEIALQITRALVAAEKRGLVHRDLKPANIMLMAGGENFSGTGSKSRGALGEPWIKVIDFGLAKAINAAVASTGVEDSQGPLSRGGFMGTPQFASPEQFGRVETDVRSDVFSLGAVLWYLLTGNLLFKGRSLDEIRDQQLHRPLPLDLLADMHVPAPFVELLGSMLASDPAKRPASATESYERLEQCLVVPPAASPAVPPATVDVPPARRRPSWALIGIPVLLLLLAGAVGLAYWLKRPSAKAASVEASAPPGARVAANGTVLSSLPPAGRSQILYVANYQTNSVGMYDGFTGEPINPALITGLSKPNFITVVPPLPTVTLRAVSPQIKVGGEAGEFTLNLSAPQSYDVTVYFKMTGTAVNGVDYELTGSTAKIEAGKTSQTIRIVPRSKGPASSETRTVKLDLAPGDGYSVRTGSSTEVGIVNQ